MFALLYIVCIIVHFIYVRSKYVGVPILLRKWFNEIVVEKNIFAFVLKLKKKKKLSFYC